jgi:hypothetical protein
MKFCAETTFEDSWDCIRESNGEYLPYLIFAECMWWLCILIGMRLGVQGIRKRLRRKQRHKRLKKEQENKWVFPPKNN